MKSIKTDNTLFILPPRRLDSTTADVFQDLVLGHIEQGEQWVVFDFTSCEYMSSVGLRTLLVAAQRLHKSGIKLLFVCKQATLLSVFKSAGFMMLFPFYEELALAATAHGLVLPQNLDKLSSDEAL
jgi:anti-sigma B factor antagonist